MPLHLLGKKSWNVYNSANIAKVKQDEALASAHEAAEEQRMQEADSERRIQILRGLPVTPSSPPENAPQRRASSHGITRRDKKRRRVANEDDTTFAIRVAQESLASHPPPPSIKPSNDIPLTTPTGHINLFPPPSRPAKNPEAEAEADKKKRELEDQYTLRFSNAAGFKQSVGQTPWYHTSVFPAPTSPDTEPPVSTPKDVWGNEDPRRLQREKLRAAAEDPLALIQKGVSELRRTERERRKHKDEQERHNGDEFRAAGSSRRRQRPRDDGLEGFSLDAHPHKSLSSRRQHRHHHHQHRHHHHHSERKHDTLRHEPESRPGWETGKGGRYSNQFAAALDLS